MSKAEAIPTRLEPAKSDDSVVDRFLAGIVSADMPAVVFSDEAVFDATVPNWRYQVRGAEAVQAELAKWYADRGRFREIDRTDIPGGEFVEFTLTWTEDGIEHMCHQAHVLQLQNNQVIKDTVWCGGRWPADLVAEMDAATTG